MNTSPLAFVRKTIADILREDPQIMVTGTFDDEAFVNGKIVCYPYCVSMEYDTASENSRGHGLAEVPFDILCNGLAPADPSKKGVASDVMAGIASRIQYRIDNFDTNTAEPATDGRYQTHLVTLAVTGASGDFSMAENKVRVGITGLARIITILQ